jgi:hypothetical protein
MKGTVPDSLPVVIQLNLYSQYPLCPMSSPQVANEMTVNLSISNSSDIVRHLILPFLAFK